MYIISHSVFLRLGASFQIMPNGKFGLKHDALCQQASFLLKSRILQTLRWQSVKKRQPNLGPKVSRCTYLSRCTYSYISPRASKNDLSLCKTYESKNWTQLAARYSFCTWLALKQRVMFWCCLTSWNGGHGIAGWDWRPSRASCSPPTMFLPSTLTLTLSRYCWWDQWHRLSSSACLQNWEESGIIGLVHFGAKIFSS